MKKKDAIPHLNELNKIILGSTKIITAIDDDKKYSVNKAIRACCKNSAVLAQEIKFIITQLTEKDSTGAKLPDGFNDIFKGFSK